MYIYKTILCVEQNTFLLVDPDSCTMYHLFRKLLWCCMADYKAEIVSQMVSHQPVNKHAQYFVYFPLLQCVHGY